MSKPEDPVLERYQRLERGVRNIIYNVEQSPGVYTDKDILRSLRRALGIGDGERV